jgi:DNA-binding beta-propeller fold protein YncE
MSHTDDVIPGELRLPGPVAGKRTRRRWLLLALLGVAALTATVVTIQVQHFLYGSVPLAYMSPDFGRTGWGLTGVGSVWDRPVVSPDGRTLYVPSGRNSITPVATATRKAAPRIRISGPGNIATIAVTPDSRTLFAAMLIESSTVPGLPLARMDLRTGRETGQINVPGGARDFVLSRDGKTLYVVSEFRFNDTGDVHAALYAVSAATGRIERRVPVPRVLLDGEVGMVLSPDGGILYLATAADSGQNTVTSVSLRTGQPGSTVRLAQPETALAITPDGRTLYVATSGMTDEVQQTEEDNRVTAIDTAASRVRASLPWRAVPTYLTMAPDGKTLWVVSTTGEEETTADNTVTPVNVATDQPGPSFHTSGWLNLQDPPSAAAISPDSRTLYVAARNGLATFRVPLPTHTNPRPGPRSRPRAPAAQQPDRPRTPPSTENRALCAPAQVKTTGLPGRAGGSVPSQTFLTSTPQRARGRGQGTTTPLHHPKSSQDQDQIRRSKRRGNPETPRLAPPSAPVSGFPPAPPSCHPPAKQEGSGSKTRSLPPGKIGDSAHCGGYGDRSRSRSRYSDDSRTSSPSASGSASRTSTASIRAAGADSLVNGVTAVSTAASPSASSPGTAGGTSPSAKRSHLPPPGAPRSPQSHPGS